MQSTLSPKDVARAIGVSESSLRRWTDEGHLAMHKTAGGHRRIALSEAIRFIRASGSPVVDPDALGLTEVAKARQLLAHGRDADRPAALYQALLHGEASSARGIVLDLFFSGWSVAQLCDGPIRDAMARIGELWSHDPEGIALEHRATDICVQTLNQLRILLPQARADAPVALGGGPAGDPYTIPSLMVAAALAEAGYRELNLGADTPAQALTAAVARHGPRLVWLAVSAPIDRSALNALVAGLLASAAPRGGQVVLGGRRVTPDLLEPRPGLRVVLSIAELSAFAQGVRDRPPASRVKAFGIMPVEGMS